MTTTNEPVGGMQATGSSLPPGVAEALADPAPARVGSVEAAGTIWGRSSWGNPNSEPLLLVHGVTSDAGIWWRIGPALAAAGRHVVAVDMPGHGPTPWRGRHRFTETAEDLAAFIRAAGLDRSTLAVVGHSWGGMVSAHLPAAGLRPSVLVLLDPPVLTLPELQALTREPTEQNYDTMPEARSAVRAKYPMWSDGDVEAKARALTQFSAEAVLAVLLQNGDWDAGMAALRHPSAAGARPWLIRGESSSGGFIHDAAVPAIEAQLGLDRVLTIAGGAHSPQRTHPEATVAAILHALAGA